MFLPQIGTTTKLAAGDWECAFCGEIYKEGSRCSNDEAHWDEFMQNMTRPRHATLQRGAA